MTKKSERTRKILRGIALAIFAIMFMDKGGECAFSLVKTSLATHSSSIFDYAYLVLFISATLMLIFTSETIFRRIRKVTLFQMK